MRKRELFSVFGLGLSVFFVAIGIASADIPHRYLIRPSGEVSSASIRDLLEKAGLVIKEHLDEIDVYVTDATDPVRFEKVELQRLKDSGMLLYIEPNSEVRALLVPNDPLYPQQEETRRLSVQSAWDRSLGSREIVVAVTDTGIELDHPDLSNQLWTDPLNGTHGWNFVGGNSDVSDDHSHGTHVSGIIGAEGNNFQGVAGVNWQTSLMTLKFLDANGSGTLENALYAVLFAANHGARLINASWGGNFPSLALRDAIQYAFSRGGLLIAAAGNGSDNDDVRPIYPAAFNIPGVISVASSSDFGRLSDFSNFGILSVDLAAPGSNILSTLPNHTYGRYSGTSMATPMITGIGALILSLAPGLSAIDLRNAILNAVDERATYFVKLATSGDANAAHALQSLSGGFQVWPGKYTIPSGGAAQLTAFGGQGGVTWSVNNPEIASVSPTGEVRGLSGGVVIVTARDSTGQIASNQWLRVIGPSSTPGCSSSRLATRGSEEPWEQAGAALTMGLPLIAGLLSRKKKRFR